ncbi:two-component sensor histidine kinase [[Phormidium ambiguum] IAM M-71]|uniref:histidine kinase n=1 Tax=[Phormidium ambiguum] IAM M-71 TaxID=454136 RepID=A0A1U7ITV4_9CYAN|nr:HAMP domain-containing sensor histidine kinase [Phormidium ambiguum]OKH40957.1 two-component sensor histidine kinase [Phormidium ambiguum IAM M-71]
MKANIFSKNDRRNTWVMIAIAFAIVISLEYATPSEYLFGYLYIGPILLTNYRLGRRANLQVTLAASVLTLLNLLIPREHLLPPTVANRLIAVLALLVTGWLSDRIRHYEEAIAHQQAQLLYQKQLASMREDFISTLTHDLKTPLLGAIETIKSFQRGQFGECSFAQRKVLEMMIRSHQSTLQLVQTLLDIYHYDSEGLKLQLTSVNLCSLVEEVIATLTELAASRRVHITLNYGESNFRKNLWVNGDALQLQRVFTNLLINAINHSPRGGKINVILESDSHQQVVKILDCGQGIPTDELAHLFERFYQGNSDRQSQGSGLGLYLSRQIIAAHGGTIWAENLLPSGALFGFRLPTSPATSENS